MAEKIATAAPLAVQATIAAAKDALELSEKQAFAKLDQHLQPLLKTQDLQEGVDAMLERRAPRFEGK